MAGPTLGKRQLGMELRRLRDTAGLTREDAAEEIACAPTKITHLESGRNSPHKAELTVRDSKNPAGPVLWFIPAGWTAFTAGVRDGDVD